MLAALIGRNKLVNNSSNAIQNACWKKLTIFISSVRALIDIWKKNHKPVHMK